MVSFQCRRALRCLDLQDRDLLRRELDRFRRQSGFLRRASSNRTGTLRKPIDLVLGGAAQKAFNLTEESDEVRNRYGRDSFGDKALLARRLVESGVTFVTMSDAWGHWDHHGDEVQWGGIAKGLTPMLPVLDRGITASDQRSGSARTAGDDSCDRHW
jgi:hypothetical protein